MAAPSATMLARRIPAPGWAPSSPKATIVPARALSPAAAPVRPATATSPRRRPAPACAYRPPFLRLCLRRLRALGLPVTDEQIEGLYTRWSGDSAELRRAEILILEPPR